MNDRNRSKLADLMQFELNCIRSYGLTEMLVPGMVSVNPGRIAKHEALYQRLEDIRSAAAAGASDRWIAAQLRVEGYDTRKNTVGLSRATRAMLSFGIIRS